MRLVRVIKAQTRLVRHLQSSSIRFGIGLFPLGLCHFPMLFSGKLVFLFLQLHLLLLSIAYQGSLGVLKFLCQLVAELYFIVKLVIVTINPDITNTTREHVEQALQSLARQPFSWNTPDEDSSG